VLATILEDEDESEERETKKRRKARKRRQQTIQEIYEGLGPVLHPCSARMSFKLTLFGTRADTEPLAAASLCSFRRGDSRRSVLIKFSSSELSSREVGDLLTVSWDGCRKGKDGSLADGEGDDMTTLHVENDGIV